MRGKSRALALDSQSDQENSDKGIWTKICAAWPHKDGKGFNLELEMVSKMGLKPSEYLANKG